MHISCTLSYSGTSRAHLHIHGLPQTGQPCTSCAHSVSVLTEENLQRGTLSAEVHSVFWSLSWRILTGLFGFKFSFYGDLMAEGFALDAWSMLWWSLRVGSFREAR